MYTVHFAGSPHIIQLENSCFSSSTRIPRTKPPTSFSTVSAQGSPSLSIEQKPQHTILPFSMDYFAESF